jgi:hypothetical protein
MGGRTLGFGEIIRRNTEPNVLQIQSQENHRNIAGSQDRPEFPLNR